ncbi:unnamed protein product [Victoria cruziana]
MGKKRKHVEKNEEKEEKAEEQRPQRTLLGRKDKKPKEGHEAENGRRPVFRNREKVLVTCSRRIVFRYRHLMLNVVSLLPHCKKDNKVESKENKGATLNELVELRNCSYCLFFECRKQKDLYLWMAKCPDGPSVKFLVNAVHTMEELKLSGNHLKGSRPILTFSNNFDARPHWQLLKEMITQVGPRFCLNPIKIFSGSFGGETLYQNPYYVSPNQLLLVQQCSNAVATDKVNDVWSPTSYLRACANCRNGHDVKQCKNAHFDLKKMCIKHEK